MDFDISTAKDLGRHTCPLATAPPQVWDPVEPGSDLEDGHVYRVAAMPLMVNRYSLEAMGPQIAPEGFEKLRPNPDKGVFHKATFLEMPDGYATERWGGARAEVAYVQCQHCKATFPKAAFDAEISGK